MKLNEIFLFTFLIMFNHEIVKSVQLRKSIKEVELHKYKNSKMITYELKARKTNDISLVSIQNREDVKSNSTQIIQNLKRKSTEYSGVVKIGNPPQEFEMVFDTGSANFLITSIKCENGGCRRHKKYDSSISNSSRIIQGLKEFNEDYVRNLQGERDQVFIRFGTGSVKCELVEDSVCIGDNFCVDKLLILEAFEESDLPFSNVYFDGIIGLSHSHLSVNSQSNFIDRLIAENKISRKVFSFYLNKDDSRNSQVHLGGINIEQFSGDIYFADVISKNYWEVKLDSIWYGDYKMDFCSNSICTAVIDSGTSMLAFPSPIMKTLLTIAQVDENCNNLNILSNLKFEINGVFFNIDPEFYVMKVSEEMLNYGYETKKDFLKEEMRCINAFMTLNALSTNQKLTIILGIPFFKKYYTIFDREINRVGFALADHK